jgi:very-short-patch-repair endonuclease
MTRKLKSSDIDDLCRLYQSGFLESDLAKRFNVAYQAIHSWLVKRDVPLRSLSEGHRIAAARASKEERARRSKAAHDAVRGKRQTLEHREKIALTREDRQISISPIEMTCARALRRAGFDCTPQKAIGPYNVDIAINEPPVAVEIFGGGWHGSGRHAARFKKRIKYILDRGWSIVIVWADRDRPYGRGATKYIVSLAEKIRRGETVGRQEQMIWGNGHPSTAGEYKLNGRAGIPGPQPRDETTGRFRLRSWE